MAKYLEIKEKVFKGRTTKADEMLFEEIKGPSGNTVDVGKLAEIVDVCNHLPLLVKRSANKSGEIYQVLSSNKRSNFDAKASMFGGNDDKELHIILE